MKKLIVGCLAAAMIWAAPAAAQNIVTNGDFESRLTNWTTNGWGTNTGGVISGTYSATTGCVGDGCIHNQDGSFNTVSGAYLYQDLTTLAGAGYNIDFDFGAAGFTNELVVLFGNATAFDMVNLTSTDTHYTISNLIATGTTTRLLFLGRQDPSFNRLDNVTVVQTGRVPAPAVPEPATWAMLITGFGVIGVAMRRAARRSEEKFEAKIKRIAEGAAA